MAITVGIDIGSTSVKAVRYDAVGDRVLASASSLLDARVVHEPMARTSQGETAPAGRWEEDPWRLLQATERVLRGVATTDVAAVCFTGQMHGGLVTDAAGHPWTAAVTWQDRRAVPLIEALRARGGNAWHGVGCDIGSGYLGATVAWWLEQRPPWMAEDWKVAGLYEWVAATLLGVPAFTDPGSAAAWGVYDIQAGGWSAGALHACGLAARRLPPVTDSGVAVATQVAHATRLGLRADVRLVSGTGDTQASYLGSSCRASELLLNIGTGAQLLWESDTFGRRPGTDVRPLPRLPGRKAWLCTVPSLCGGAAYARLADFYVDVLRTFGATADDRDALYERMNEAAARADSQAAGVRAAPLFNGSRRDGEARRAHIDGLDSGNFRVANVTRAMLTGMVDELRDIQREFPHRFDGLVGSGNGLRRNATLREIAQARFGLPLRLSPFTEEAAVGAARLAAHGVR